MGEGILSGVFGEDSIIGKKPLRCMLWLRLQAWGITLENFPVIKSMIDPTPEEIEAVMKTDWAKNWARGMLKFMGIEPGTPEYQQLYDKLRERAAIGLLT